MAQKILVIDDPLTAAELADNVLAKHFPGCDVFTAPRASEAIERLVSANPDLVLLNDSLPETDARQVLARLRADASLTETPVIVLSEAARAGEYRGDFPNIARVLERPAKVEALVETIGAILGEKAVSRRLLPERSGGITFTGHTGVIAPRQALQMAQGERLSGVLRWQLGRNPIELWMSGGRFLFATTRNFALYCAGSPVILSATNLSTIVEAEMHQRLTGCPIFLHPAVRGGFAHDDVVQIVKAHGQRLFSHTFTAGRIGFEFEERAEFPDYTGGFPAGNEDADNWLLGSLRHVRIEQLAPSQRPSPDASPAYTRRGYDSVQRLRLNDAEARFASAVNGSEPLHAMARSLGLTMNDAQLIAFRLQSLDVMDLWNPGTLSLPPAA